ncbi:hypothetical protein GE09DRAFT_1254556 [Coniochaeta sp. 2T2.1]|nr:hypothetical protein GE09DRAFT_1254556 [Coniochaeta sp. 2T2.1]
MDQLPLELIMHIVSMVVGNHHKEDRCVKNKTKDSRAVARVVNGSLAGLTTVSRKFQRAVEPHLFSHLEVRYEELPAFSRIMTEQRQVYLKSLAFAVYLDNYPMERTFGTAAMAPRGAPFRLFGVTDECGIALWKILTNEEASKRSLSDLSAPSEASWSALERLVIRFDGGCIRDIRDRSATNAFIERFASACKEIPNLQAAALLKINRYLSMPGHIKLGDGHRVLLIGFDGEWGAYCAAPGVRSPWLLTATALVYEAMQKLTLEAEPPSVLAEDLRVPRLTFNTRGWYPRPEVVASLCAAFSESTVSIVRADLWQEVQRPFLEAKWRREQTDHHTRAAPC